VVIIKPEGPEHAAGVRAVEEQAFGRAGEADLCERVSGRGAATLSLVALDDGQVVGHVLFTPVTIVNGEERFEVVGLGPVAVTPRLQSRGIGSKLIVAGLEELRQQGCPAVVLLGHPDYYPRFGFVPASRYGIRFSDPNVPEEAFMALELRRGALENHPGVAHYQAEFDEV
jgi:putative acetyltransferase